MSTIDTLILYNMFMLSDGDFKSPEKVGWVNKFDQDIRFKTLLEIGVKTDDTILDWGCGLGHLIDYMNINNVFVNYIGIDINEDSLIETRKMFPDNNFKVGDIEDETEKYDWILASGIFSFQVSKEEMFRKLDKALALSNKGVAFNCLIKSELFPEELGYSTFDSNEILKDLCVRYKQDSSIWVSLITDYTHDDFTIYLKKIYHE